MSFLSSIGSSFGGNGWGNLIGGIIGAFGSHDSGKDIEAGANKGAAIDQGRWDQLQGQMSPWTQSGGYAQGALNQYLGIGGNKTGSGYGSILKPYGQSVPSAFKYTGQAAPGTFNPTAYKPFTIQDFHNLSPAYAFQKQQGMQGVLNGNSAGSGALSGAASKDLIGYNQNLANTAWDNAFGQNMASQQQRYQQQLGTYEGQLQGYNSQFGNQLAGYGMNLEQQQQGFNQYQQQQNNIYSRLLGVSTLGQQGTAELGTFGENLAKDQAQGYTNAGVGAAYGQNGVNSGLQQVAMGLPWEDMAKSWFGGGGSSAGAGAASTSGASGTYGNLGALGGQSQGMGTMGSFAGASAPEEATVGGYSSVLGGSGAGGVGIAAGDAGAGVGGPMAGAGSGYASTLAGVGGDTAAFTPAAMEATSGGAAGGAAGGAGSGVGAGLGATGAAAGIAVPVALALMTQPYSMNASYWNSLTQQLTTGQTGKNATYDKNTPPDQQKYDAKQSLYRLIQEGATKNLLGKSGQGIPPNLMQLAKSYGMLNSDGSLNPKWSAGTDPFVAAQRARTGYVMYNGHWVPGGPGVGGSGTMTSKVY